MAVQQVTTAVELEATAPSNQNVQSLLSTTLESESLVAAIDTAVCCYTTLLSIVLLHCCISRSMTPCKIPARVQTLLAQC